MPALPENGYIQLARITDDLGNPARVSQIAGVYRLAVEAIIMGGGGLVTALDNDAIAAAQTTLLDINLNQVYDGTTWRRLAGGTDNAAAVAAAGRTGAFVAGIARSALAAYTDGDVALPTFDLAGRLMVNMGSIATVLDNNAVAAGLDQETVIPLNYGYDAVNALWRRLNVDPVAGATNEALYRLQTRAALTANNPAAVAGSRNVLLNAGGASTAQDETLMRLLCRCALAGLDYSAAAGSQSVALAARNVGVSPVDERYPGAYSLAFVRGINSGVAAGSQGVAVEARDFSTPFTEAILAANIGLLTNSRMAVYDTQVGWYASTATSAAAVGNTITERLPSLNIVQTRESGFAAARRGKRFYVTNRSMYSYGTLLTGQTSFVTTTPTLLCRVDSASIRAVVRSINLSIGNTPGGVVYVAVHLDTVDRYSSGGVSPVPSNTNEETTNAADSKWYENAVTTIVQATTRPLGSALAPATPGTNIQISFADGVLLGPSHASLLVYVWAASTAPQILYNAEIEEVT